MFYRDERLALFIDGANLYAAAKALGVEAGSSTPVCILGACVLVARE